MSIINTIISNKSFELIRDQIGAILKIELANQILLGSDVTYGNVWIERTVPFNHTEVPAVNIKLPKINYSRQDARFSDGLHFFGIEVYHKAPSTDVVDGDSDALIKLQRLIGVIKGILEDVRYETLGFAKPFISNRHVEEINIEPIQRQDSLSCSSGVIIFSVRAPETSELIQPRLLVDHITTVKLVLTDLGYKYVFIYS